MLNFLNLKSKSIHLFFWVASSLSILCSCSSVPPVNQLFARLSRLELALIRACAIHCTWHCVFSPSIVHNLFSTTHHSINLFKYKEIKMATVHFNNGNMSIQNPPSGSEDQISKDTETSDAPISENGDFVIDMETQLARFSGIFQDNNPILLSILEKRIKENDFDVSNWVQLAHLLCGEI